MILGKFFLILGFFSFMKSTKVQVVAGLLTCRVNKNIIGAPKIQKYLFCALSICVFFLLQYCSFNFSVTKVVAFNLFALFLYKFCTLVHVSFLCYTPYSYHSFKWCHSNIYRSFLLLKSLAKNKELLFGIAL